MMRKGLLLNEVNVTSYADAVKMVIDWSDNAESRYVCIANVHVLMEAYDSPEFRNVLNHADLITPDGVPLVWMMRLKGQRAQQRVYGPALMLRVLEAAAQEKIPVGFYGGTPEVLRSLIKRMQERYEGLQAAFAFSPPFMDVNHKENEELVEQINKSGIRILFVGLGCPKQEIWMANHRGRVNAVMLGVGAAFDFHAGAKPQAPEWMQVMGLEWLFRLSTEPRRLWKRYLYQNPRFIFLAIADLLGLLRRTN
jgi:N-acetylglucosaminyldiphosphoundecaprenol N-acetyl-beta-D-mannosaminyltransferase